MTSDPPTPRRSLPDTSFVVGANLPWVNYGCDFGANAWYPNGGLASATSPEPLVRTLEELAGLGVTVIRWFLFCDGRAGIRFDGNGVPAGLDARVFPDLDAALALAGGAGLRVMFVLFDFHWCRRRRRVRGVELGGHRRTLIDAGERGRLVERVVTPVLDRYGRHPGVWAWDVINEPEWVTFGYGAHNPFRAVPGRAMRALIDDVTRAAHSVTSQPVTVGLASARWLTLVRGSALDFYQVHWYDRLDARAPLDAAVSELGVDRPVMLGEFPTRNSARGPDEILRVAAGRGYAGAMLWSALAVDRATDFPNALRGLRAFRDVPGPSAPLDPWTAGP